MILNVPKILDRQVWQNLIMVCTVCHSVCMFWTHCCMVILHYSNVRIFTAFFFQMSHFFRFLWICGGPWENVFYVICEQQRRRSACASAQSDQHLCCSLPRYYNISSFYIRSFKPLASFCGWAGQFESYLVANPKDSFSCDKAHIYFCRWKP